VLFRKAIFHLPLQPITDFIKQTESNPFPLSNTPVSTKAARTRTEQVRGAHDWTVQTNRLLTQISQCLSSTIESWETFDSEKAHYFADMNKSAYLMLQSVRDTFSELRSLKKRLDDLKLPCEDFAKAVSSNPATQFSLTKGRNSQAQSLTSPYGIVA
jgi:hypothetical protein